ncbi:MAG TPA: hypothetical protein VG733_19825 [Chthoniobacteraceae bacterium]|nr:hypothetical protein [Chthoniobacteraceae bacterium]
MKPPAPNTMKMIVAVMAPAALIASLQSRAPAAGLLAPDKPNGMETRGMTASSSPPATPAPSPVPFLPGTIISISGMRR